MHAGFPCFSNDIRRVLQLGEHDPVMPQLVESAGGTALAGGIALLLKMGFGYVMRDGLLDQKQSQHAERFFQDNFVFNDPYAENGHYYYQGRFLIRTRKPGDNMNVLLRFCPDPDALYIDTAFGRCLNPLSVISTEILDEGAAQALEEQADAVDLVIRFKDIVSILKLIGRNDVDLVGLLLENVVQLSGNVGHLFKLGAIAKNIELELDVEMAANDGQH